MRFVLVVIPQSMRICNFFYAFEFPLQIRDELNESITYSLDSVLSSKNAFPIKSSACLSKFYFLLFPLLGNISIIAYEKNMRAVFTLLYLN